MSDVLQPLTSDPIALRAMLAAERAENERLRQIIKELQRHRFGRRAETLPVDQLLLGLEEAEQVEAEGSADEEAADPAKRADRALRRRANRGSLPGHLPRIEQIVDIADRICPCCRGQLHVMGEDVSERLDVVPAQFRVIVTHRPKYACRACQEVVVQAPAASGRAWSVLLLTRGGLPMLPDARRLPVQGRANKAVMVSDDHPTLLRARRRKDRWSEADARRPRLIVP